ncbi:L,D-transpeptidase family protein [Fulvimarina sp. 2208YS6-2-32]|uniref:L,D-transpeptidase family protein n=1 Tax=Fulvimarina uroteuthidis TaxID=3098149 RepID=A0ABU5I1D0_9HYPH|nr:L,D-transpeptidase family protein [Fulvimarina sp. 2208YS6-2-32]MDY8108563.1 L,D-transpeptidase family protein [Fulvimarina sp. 2208YS6-2-32]
MSFLVRRSPLSPLRGILAAGPYRIPCALGRSSTTVFKAEGDGATPVARMALLSTSHRLWRMQRPDSTLPGRITRPQDGWCDAPRHAAYNRAVTLPFGASAESMARADRLYDFVVVLDWNVRSRRRHRGSAIFFHIARPGYPPTEGCVAIAPRDMLKIAPLLKPGAVLTVVR